MKRSRFTQEQIIGVLKEYQAGATVADVCRKHGISDATFYTRRSKYGGMEVSDNGCCELRTQCMAGAIMGCKVTVAVDALPASSKAV